MLIPLPPAVMAWLSATLDAPENRIRLKPLPTGVNAELAQVDFGGSRWVLKRYRQGCDTDRHFEAWCERLRSVPRHVNVEQLAAGRRVDGAAYALFTFVAGRAASREDNPLTRPQLDALFQRLLPSLDRAGFLNHDLNLGNLLTTESDVGLIDLEYLEPFSPTPSRDLQCLLNSDFWECPIPANRVSLEREGIGPYLEAMVSRPSGGSKAGAWFAEYLAASPPYHVQRAEWLGSLGQPALAEAVEYEQVRAEALRSPEPELVRAEALRLQVYFDAFAPTLYVDWRGQPDRSQRLASALALRADADTFLDEAESLAAGGRLRPSAARWMSMNARSVRIMRQVLAGNLQPWGENPWLQELGRKRFPAGMPAELHVVRALRADPEPDVFVPFGWAARLAF